jgi:hypothetical protein
MTWLNKTKVETRIDRGRILTPDGNQILVGAGEDVTLIYQVEGSLWGNNAKTASGSYTKKTKITSPWSNKTKTVS